MLKLARLLLALLIATTGSLAPVQARMAFDGYGSGRLTMPSTKQLSNRYIPSLLFWTPTALGSARVVDLVRQPNGSYVDVSGNGYTFTGPDANGQYASETGWVLPQPFTVVDIFDNAASPNSYQITFAGDASPGASGSRAIVFERFNGGAPQLLGGSGNASFGSAIRSGASHTLVATFNGASSFAAVDGVQYAALNTGTAGITNGFRTGGGDPGSYFNGTLKRRIIVSGVLAADDELRIEGYGAISGGGALLPSHPFSATLPVLGAAIPAVRGATLAQIAPGSNVARLGAYGGVGAKNPDGSSSLAHTETLFGAPVRAHKVFGQKNPPGLWGDGSGNEIAGKGGTLESSIGYSLSLLKGRGLQLNLSIPNALGDYSGGRFAGATLADAASGAADVAWAKIAHMVIDGGFADDPANPAQIGPGQEMNGDWFPWGKAWDEDTDTWVNAYRNSARRMAQVMQPIFTAAGKHAIFFIAYNKGKSTLSYSGDLARLWPGDDLYKAVSMDAYFDTNDHYSDPTNETDEARWAGAVLGTTSSYSLAWLDLFARTPNMRGPGFIDGLRLPMILGEWAAGGPTSIQDLDYVNARARAGGDSGYYTTKMLQWFKDRFVSHHYFYDIYDTSIGFQGSVGWHPQNTGMAAAGYSSATGQQIVLSLQPTGTVASGATTITGVSDTTNVVIGADINLNGVVPYGAKVTAKTVNTLTLSTPTIAASAAGATFYIGQSTKTYTVAAGLPFQVGMPVIVRDDTAANDNFIEATVSSYSGTVLVVNGFASKGAGSPAAVHVLTHPAAVMPNSYAAIKAAAQ